MMSNAIISKEFSDQVLELTLALYRVTDAFPQDEVLKKQLREKANTLLAGIIECRYAEHDARIFYEVLAKTRAISGYLKIARIRSMAKLVNILVLEREYKLVGDVLEKKLQDREAGEPTKPKDSDSKILSSVNHNAPKPTKPNNTSIDKSSKKRSETSTFSPVAIEEPSDRQRVIIEHLKEKNMAKISDFFAIFQNVSSKTIQRDLQDLVRKDILRREGDRRWTIYTLSNVR